MPQPLEVETGITAEPEVAPVGEATEETPSLETPAVPEETPEKPQQELPADALGTPHYSPTLEMIADSEERFFFLDNEKKDSLFQVSVCVLSPPFAGDFG